MTLLDYSLTFLRILSFSPPKLLLQDHSRFHFVTFLLCKYCQERSLLNSLMVPRQEKDTTQDLLDLVFSNVLSLFNNVLILTFASE